MQPPLKPTVMLFAGSFHPASSMDRLVAKLQALGFPAEANTLPTVGDPGKGLGDDEQYIKSAMMSHIDESRYVLPVFHSYAGFPGCAAISGLDKTSRLARGERSGVLGVIYMCAWVPKRGATVLELLGGKVESWMTVNEQAGLIESNDHANVFYHDCDGHTISAVVPTLKGHSIKAMMGVPSVIGATEKGYNNRRAYIRTLNDAALPVHVQDELIKSSGVDWTIKSLPSSHSPFLSMPDETSHIIKQLAEEFISVK